MDLSALPVCANRERTQNKHHLNIWLFLTLVSDRVSGVHQNLPSLVALSIQFHVVALTRRQYQQALYCHDTDYSLDGKIALGPIIYPPIVIYRRL